MTHKKQVKKHIETSKLILLVSYIMAGLLSLIVIIGSFTEFDMSNITTITALAWAEVASGNIWYFKKSAKENVPKVIANMPEEFRKQIDINQLLNE